MLRATPHTLQVRTTSEPQTDEFGRQISEGEETWTDVAPCFCHDNSQMKQVSVNGELWTYNYHVVYEGSKLALGTHIRCLDDSGSVIGEGDVTKNAECYSKQLKGKCDLWV